MGLFWKPSWMDITKFFLINCPTTAGNHQDRKLEFFKVSHHITEISFQSPMPQSCQWFRFCEAEPRQNLILTSLTKNHLLFPQIKMSTFSWIKPSITTLFITKYLQTLCRLIFRWPIWPITATDIHVWEVSILFVEIFSRTRMKIKLTT